MVGVVSTDRGSGTCIAARISASNSSRILSSWAIATLVHQLLAVMSALLIFLHHGRLRSLLYKDWQMSPQRECGEVIKPAVSRGIPTSSNRSVIRGLKEVRSSR